MQCSSLVYHWGTRYSLANYSTCSVSKRFTLPIESLSKNRRLDRGRESIPESPADHPNAQAVQYCTHKRTSCFLQNQKPAESSRLLLPLSAQQKTAHDEFPSVLSYPAALRDCCGLRRSMGRQLRAVFHLHALLPRTMELPARSRRRGKHADPLWCRRWLHIK